MSIDNRRRNILEKTAFSGGARRIIGHTYDANTRISVYINRTYQYNGSPTSTSGSWSVNSDGVTYYATSDSNKYFEIYLPDDLVITSMASMCATGDCMNQLVDINLAYMGDVSNVESLLYCFDSNTRLKTVMGFGKFNSLKKLRTVEGMFRSNQSIECVDFTGLNTSGMDRGIIARYGFPVMLYQISSIKTLFLPEMPHSAYIGSAAFSGCTSLTNVTATGEIGVPIRMGDSPLTAQSIKSILSHLSDTPPSIESEREAVFSSASWVSAIGDPEIKSIAIDKRAKGWRLPDIPLYANNLSDVNLYTDGRPGGWYSFGVETDTSIATYEWVYVMLNEINNQNYDWCNIDLTDGAQYIDVSQASKMTFTVKGMPENITRNGITVTNQYISMVVSLVDYDGNTSSFVNEGTTISSAKIFEVAYNTSLFAGVDLGKITSIRVALTAPNDSLKARQKGIWVGGIAFS